MGAAGLGVVVALLPFSTDGSIPTLPEQALAYAPILLPVGVFLYGLLFLCKDLAARELLLLALLSGALGAGAAYGSRPDTLLDGPEPVPLMLLYVADTLRIAAAACVGFALARRVDSPRIALLIAVLATAADLFSVFAGPTKALVEGGAPALDYLLLWFPTFGYPLGFALGVSDFVFLALFTAVACHLPGLRPLLTLALGCAAILIAMLMALLLGGRPLPALPFVAAAFILANALPLARALLPKGNP